jgi:hypothetical protein
MFLPSGDGLIITPNSTLDQCLNHLRSHRPFPLTPQAVMSQILPAFEGTYGAQHFSRGTVSLDSVVLSDGGIIGPDRLGIIAVEGGQLVVENEVIARFSDPSAADAELRTWLNAMSNAPLPESKLLPTAAGHIALYRITLAKALINRLNTPGTGGRESIVPTLKAHQLRRTPAPSALRKLD